MDEAILMDFELIHIPRTGGTSLREAMGVPLRDREHDLAVDYAGALPMLSVVRNPYDRAVSLCAFLFREQLARERRALRPDEFRAWVAGGYLSADGRVPVLYARTLYAIELTTPAWVWLYDEDGALLVGRVLRFETLRDDAAAIGLMIGHVNHSVRAVGWQDYYDEPTRAAVAVRYARDFDLFGYPIE